MALQQQTPPQFGAAEYIWLGVGVAFTAGLVALLFVNRPRAGRARR